MQRLFAAVTTSAKSRRKDDNDLDRFPNRVVPPGLVGAGVAEAVAGHEASMTFC
jgi:hypothetical protein